MLAGVGWTMQDYLKYGENDYYPPLPNGHRLFLHDIRRVAVRCAVAMGEEGDMVVSFLKLGCAFLSELVCFYIPSILSSIARALESSLLLREPSAAALSLVLATRDPAPPIPDRR